MKVDMASLHGQIALLQSVVSLLIHTHHNQDVVKQLLPLINEKFGAALADPIEDLWPELAENFNLDD
jgi:hypothetical protein